MGAGTVTGRRSQAADSATADTCEPAPAARTGTAAAVLPAQSRRAARVGVITLTGGLASMAARSLAPELAEVAASAFAAPPWNETPAQARRLASRMLADARYPGFVLALAFTGGGMRLVGFGYGLPRGPVPGSAVGPLPFAAAKPFEFCELAVIPAARGIGAGRALHDAVLAASGPQPRWLVTHLQAGPAVGLYQATGWQISRVFPGASGGSRLLMTRHR